MSALPSELTTDQHRLAIETFDERTLAGLAVGIVRDGRLAWFEGPGMADETAGRRIRPEDDVVRIGSSSQELTARMLRP